MKLLMETWKKYITEVEAEEANVISFDFDDTLALADSEYEYIGPNEPLLSLFKQFKDRGYKVYIITSRKEANEDSHRKKGSATVNEFVEEYGLSPDNIIFTHPEDKVHTLRRVGVILHFDDDDYEIAAIEKHAPEIKYVTIDYTDGAITSGQEHIDELLGEIE